MSEPDGQDTGRISKAEAHVFFHNADYAGFIRRVAATAVDLIVLAALLFVYAMTLAVIGAIPTEGQQPLWFWASVVGGAYLYLTILKRSRIRSPGYWVTGIRIVDLRGRPPSMVLMTVRLLWWVLGPISPLIDLIFMTNDDRKQTIRDKLVGTYVVTKDASPAGHGRKHMGRMSFLGLMLFYPVVIDDRSDDT